MNTKTPGHQFDEIKSGGSGSSCWGKFRLFNPTPIFYICDMPYFVLLSTTEQPPDMWYSTKQMPPKILVNPSILMHLTDKNHTFFNNPSPTLPGAEKEKL